METAGRFARELAGDFAAAEAGLHWHPGCFDAKPANKVDPSDGASRTCQVPANIASVPIGKEGTSYETVPKANAAHRGQVAAMVEQALDDQRALLETKIVELRRWDRRAQANFVTWFGTLDGRARQLILARMTTVLKINEAYRVANFRRALPPQSGLFAFVHPNDYSRIFLGKAFVQAPAVGTNSRAGTIVHEMSHFAIAGGTKDYAYGTANCRALARSNPSLALTNADNFEFYVETTP